MSLSKTRKIVATALMAATLGGTMAVSSAPAQAGYYGGGYRYGGYRPYYRRNNGGAIAAGLIGGLAVGALAATAARPAYGYGYGGYPAYAYPAYGAGYGGGCYIQRHKFVNEWGDLVIRREQVCD